MLLHQHFKDWIGSWRLPEVGLPLLPSHVVSGENTSTLAGYSGHPCTQFPVSVLTEFSLLFFFVIFIGFPPSFTTFPGNLELDHFMELCISQQY